MADSVPRLIVISDTKRAPIPLLLSRFACLGRAARAKSVLFVLRDYELVARARLALGTQMSAAAQEVGQLFGVADRADLARALDATALHLPELGISPVDAHAFLGAAAFISRACHDPSRVAVPRADAVLLSPILAPRKGRPALGLAALAAARASLPDAGAGGPSLYALGGVDATNAGACRANGADGVAVIGAALDADPRPLLEALGILRV